MPIPKLLHYCWFGGGVKPPLVEMCMASWRRCLPDFTIIEWNESNTPTVPYVTTALGNRRWANASNLVRLLAVHELGGIYLDTDVEVLRPLHPFLSDECFFGREDEAKINNAVFGATSRHSFIGRMITEINGRFDGREYSELSSADLVTELVGDRAAVTVDSRSTNDVTVYPAQVFSPHHWNDRSAPGKIGDDTFAIHHWMQSWKIESSVGSNESNPVVSCRARYNSTRPTRGRFAGSPGKLAGNA